MSMPAACDLPVLAKVVTRRVPNAYDPTALALEVSCSDDSLICPACLLFNFFIFTGR